MFNLIDVQTLSVALGMSVEHLRRLARNGAIPAVRVGERGHLRFDVAEVRAAMTPAVRVPQADSVLAHQLPLA